MLARTLTVLVLGGLVLGVGWVGCASGASDDGATTSLGTGGQHTTTTSGTAATGGGAGNGGNGLGGGGGGGGSGGLALGAACQSDADCASNLCKPVLLDTPDRVCVSSCSSQADCPAVGGFFCEAVTVGAPNGYCIPHSPAHCLSCSSNADCGSLSEVCTIAPGDSASACHVDCSLAADAACPPDYTCQTIVIDSQQRRLCRPTPAGTSCLDAVGGYCGRVPAAQPCTRDSAAGSCTGTRDCMVSLRFDHCSAKTPACRASCATPNPDGCTLAACPEATLGPDNCGTCGNVCGGYGQNTANATCDGTTCGLSCKGENYDSDGQAANGCEAADAPGGNHTSGTASDLGSMSCDDGSSNPNTGGVMPSDTRLHENPSFTGFDPSTGSAPDWFHIYASGGWTCEDDINLSLQVSGSGNLACYQLVAYTSDGTYSCTTDGSGGCGISEGMGSYSDGTDIYLVVQKICSPAQAALVSYTLTGHL